MIRPNISPRRVTSNAAAGLFSAARTSIRGTQTNTQSIIRSSPDLTREQTFGINYVDFFGSKKNSKVLQKSMKTVRDSMVSTFGIAETLKKSVQGKDGVFGLIGKVFGGIKGIVGGLTLLALPFVSGILGLLAVGGIGALLFTFKDQILEFFQDKASGVKNIIGNIVKEFVFNQIASGEQKTLQVESEANIERLTDKNMKLGMNEIDANEAAINSEVERLEKEKLKLNPVSSNNAELRKLDAIDSRIKFLTTGIQDVPQKPGIKDPFFGKNIPFITGFTKLLDPDNMGRRFLADKILTSKAIFPSSSTSAQGQDRIDAIKATIREFGGQANIGLLRPIVEEELRKFNEAEKGKQKLSAADAQFIKDILTFLDMGGTESGFSSKEDRDKFLKVLGGIKGLPNNNQTNTDESANLGGVNNKVAMIPMNTGSNGGLTRDDSRVTDGSSPTHQIHDPFDRDNIFNIINRNSLGIIGWYNENSKVIN